MRFEYQYRTTEIITAGHNRRVYSERVDAGWLLTVLSCYLHIPDSKIGHVAEILVSDGAQELEIRSRGRDAAKQGMSTLNPFYVGEYQRVIGHSPDSNLNDKICLTVIGHLTPLWDWRSQT